MRKKTLSILLCLLTTVVLSACGSTKGGAETQTSVSAETATEKNSEELVYRRYTPLEGTYIMIKYGEREFMKDDLCWTDEAGDITLVTFKNAGTPYETEGLCFDETYFSCEAAGKYEESPYDGGGGSYGYWRLHGLQPGETEVMILTKNLMDDSFLGTRVGIIIDENLIGHVIWTEYDKENENFIWNAEEE